MLPETCDQKRSNQETPCRKQRGNEEVSRSIRQVSGQRRPTICPTPKLAVIRAIGLRRSPCQSMRAANMPSDVLAMNVAPTHTAAAIMPIAPLRLVRLAFGFPSCRAKFCSDRLFRRNDDRHPGDLIAIVVDCADLTVPIFVPLVRELAGDN